MDPEAWERLQSVFFAALERPPLERAQFLDEACGDDAAFRAEVEAVLASHERVGATPSGSAGADDGEAPGDVGRHVGPYRLEERIGRGGMGEVYRAQRADDQYRQEVAVKLVRPVLPADEMARRFRVERQVLARLQHPNVATLLDGGVAEDGRPYLVMQYVRGVPITAFADAHRLPVAARLRLFAAVCRTVHFAHSNLVVHRDLKPSNILVTADGQVRLLDFGIAKLLDPAGMEITAPLTGEHLLLTPEHAAPEQIQGDPVTTATDVYALGVLLYELLTGTRPFRVVPGGNWHRAVCEEEPAPPSDALTTLAADAVTRDAARVAETRGTRVPALRQALRGDLDHMVLMALRKEPERRYASAEQFAEDVDRHLERRPVLARRDTLAYRSRRFLRRNRAAVALAASVFVLALGFGVAMTVQAGALARERDRARLEAAKATQVAGLLTALFEAPDPFAPTTDRRDTLRVRDLLTQGARKAQAELAAQPAVQAQLLGVLGSVFRSLGDLDAAQPLLEQALATRRQLHGAAHLDVAGSEHDLALLHKAAGRYPEAEALLRHALATRRALLGDEHAEVAAALNALATVRHDRGDLAGAESLYVDALALRRRVLGGRHLDVASSLINLSTLAYQRGDQAAADTLVRAALALRRDLLGADHPEVAMTMVQLATVANARMAPAEAARLHGEALRILRAALGPEHPHVAHTLNNLAALWKTRGDYERADPLYREALALWRTLFGEEHANVALALHNLGALRKAKGDLEGAEPLYREALAMRRRLFGDAHPSVAASLNNLGVLLKEKGDRAGAVPLLREAIAVNVGSLGPDHPRVAVTMATLGELLHEDGRYGDAEPLFLKALDIQRARGTEGEVDVVRLHERLSRLYREWGRPERAATFEASAPAPAGSRARAVRDSVAS